MNELDEQLNVLDEHLAEYLDEQVEQLDLDYESRNCSREVLDLGWLVVYLKQLELKSSNSQIYR